MPDRTAAQNRISDVDAVLKDGSTVHLQAAAAADRDDLVQFYEALSLESRYLRFFGGIAHSAHLVDRWLERGVLGLLALHHGRIVGHGYYGATSSRRAEVAFAVADEMQGRGLGTLLVGQLAAIALAAGIEEFEATVSPRTTR